MKGRDLLHGKIIFILVLFKAGEKIIGNKMKIKNNGNKITTACD